MSFELDAPVIRAQGLGKRYQIYDTPRDRLKQFLLPRLSGLVGRPPRSYFREFVSLADLSFEVRRGETVGIVGRNGAGKSTLLQMLCGTLTPSDGVVEVRGRVAALLELGAGFNPEFSGRENVRMSARLLGLDESQIAQRMDAITAFADIGEFLDQPVKTYSSGMYVRLAFAVIAHVDADILVIDEALAVGDAFFAQKCMRFLRAFKERGTLLFVSHDASAVVNLCDRAILLDHGRLAMQGPAKLVMQSYLAQLYGGNEASGDEPAAAAIPTEASALPLERTLALEPLPNDGADASPRFGRGQATIHSVRLLALSGEVLRWVSGGETVQLEVRARADVPLASPIVGFIVKDRLGQHLFGDNTYERFRAAPIACAAGGEVTATFCFVMPVLPRGEYSIAVAIADGTQLDHVIHEWVHEALLFQSHSASVVTGLVGIPMLDVVLRARAAAVAGGEGEEASA